MSSRAHRRPQRHPSRHPIGRSPQQQPSPGDVPRIPRPRSADGGSSVSGLPPVFVSDDGAKRVLHRVAEDPEFQRAVDALPLVRMVGEYLEWVGEGVSPPDIEADQHALVERLDERLGAPYLSSSAVGRRRAQVIAMSCARLRLVTTSGGRLAPGPDRAGWTDSDPALRTWLRSQVAAAVLECTTRFHAGDHLLGDDVRHAFAAVVVAAGEGLPSVLGLASAARPDDVVAEHVDRIVSEHVAELQALGLCAPGRVVSAAPGLEPVLRSVAVGLRAEPVPAPAS